MQIYRELSAAASQPSRHESTPIYNQVYQKQTIEKQQQQQRSLHTVQSSRESRFQGDKDSQQQTGRESLANMYNLLNTYYGPGSNVASPAELKQRIKSLADNGIAYSINKDKQTFESKPHQFKMEISSKAYEEYKNSSVVSSENTQTINELDAEPVSLAKQMMLLLKTHQLI